MNLEARSKAGVSVIRLIRERRFVRVHLPERGLDDAIAEIVGRPKLGLRNLTYSFEGILLIAAVGRHWPAWSASGPA